MEKFSAYAWTQFAFGETAKFNAMVALALDMVAQVQQWDSETPKKSKAELESALSIAMTIAKIPETTMRRYVATVSGLALAFTRDHKAALAGIQSAMIAAENPMGAESATGEMVTLLKAEGVENMGFLETYARKGKPGIAALAASFAAKAEARAKAEAMTEAEAAEAAKAEAEAAEAAKAEQSPRAKAAKQAAAILASIAKHGDNMTDDELSTIAGAIAEVLAKRKALENQAQIMRDQAAAKAAKAEAKRDEVAEKRKAAEKRLAAAHENGDLRAMQAAQRDIDAA